MDAPECSGRIYGCPLCPDLPAMTIEETFAHTTAHFEARIAAAATTEERERLYRALDAFLSR